MARPSVEHDGFLVPNAVDASYPRMAEPDQIDFATAANARWGVVEGCLVTVSGTLATVQPGSVVIDGVLIPIPEVGTPSLGQGGSQDRFDLIVADTNGDTKVLIGNPAVDPVFPTVPVDNVLLASVFCPTGSANFTDNVVDKRRFVSKSLLTKIATDATLIQNVNGGGPDLYRMRGDGKSSWNGDTALSRTDIATLTVENNLIAAGSITAGGLVQGHRVHSVEEISGSNLDAGPYTAFPSTPIPGMIYQVTSGDLAGTVWVWGGTDWRQIAPVDSIVPVGTIVSNLEPPSSMEPGWLLLDGTVITEAQAPRLFTLSSLVGRIQGSAPGRTMALPDARGRFLLTAPDGVPSTIPGGAQNNKITLSAAQLPPHKHNTQVNPGGAGSPSATVSLDGAHRHNTSGGGHTHTLVDHEHAHHLGGTDSRGLPTGAFVCLAWGGLNKIDALFNDRNHTYSVQSAEWTNPGPSNIEISPGSSDHAHDMSVEGGHTHTVTLGSIPLHGHTTTEDPVGQSATIDITPAYLTVYTYIRT